MALLAILALLAPLLGPCLGGPPGLLALGAPAARQGSRLALLFSANVTAACAGRCTLRATAASCGARPAAASPAAAAGADLQVGWNSLVLPDAQAAEQLEAAVALECSDPSCQSAPAAFVAWRGAACRGGGGAALPARQLAGLPNATSDRVFVLGAGQPAVAVRYVPAAPRQPEPSTPSSIAAPPPLLAATASGQHPPALVPDSHAAAAAPAAALEEGQLCAGSSGLLLKLALAAWVLGCAALGAHL